MNPFDNYFPTRMIFGTGKFDILGEEVAALGKRAMIVSYANQSPPGLMAALIYRSIPGSSFH